MFKRLLFLLVTALTVPVLAQTNIIPTENTNPVNWTGQHNFSLLPIIPTTTPTVGGDAVSYSELQAYVTANSFTSAGGTLTGPLYLPNMATLLPVVNVTYPQFGTPSSCANVADPTGVADSTCPVQAAITYAQTHTIGGHTPTVYFPPGTYKITSNIVDNGTLQYSSNGASLNISNGVTVSIAQLILSGTPQLAPALGAVIANPQSTSLVNPYWNRTYVNVFGTITGIFNGWLYTGAIPGTFAYNFGQVNHDLRDVGQLDSTSGCYGFNTTCFNTVHRFENITQTILGAGGTYGQTINGIYTAIGDHIALENSISSFGGSSDSGGPEGTKGVSYFVGEITNTWLGAVAGGHGGVGQTTLRTNCSTDCGTGTFGLTSGTPALLGQGMIVTDEQAGSTVGSGQVTAYTTSGNNLPGTVTINITSGISNFVQSTCWATLNSDVVPQMNPIGAGGQSLSFVVTDVSGTCTANQLMSFTGTNHEQTVITSATAPSGGQQTITATVRLYHEAGSYIFENANSDAGLFMDMVANDVVGPSGLKYPVELVGIQSVSGNTIVAFWRIWYAGGSPASQAFPSGYMVTGNAGIGALSNTAGTVTFSIFLNWNVNGIYWPVLQNASAIYISSATNSAFNGVCTNVTISFPAGANPGTGTCTQASSTGLTSANANISLTDATNDNPYGNTRVNFYQGAQIVDVNDYSAPMTVQGVVSYPTDGLYFQVEPNMMALVAGDSLVEHHGSAQFHNYEGTDSSTNPVCYSCNPVNIQLTGIFGAGGALTSVSPPSFNNSAILVNNNSSNADYFYFGGKQAPTPLITATGLFATGILFEETPYIGSFVVDSPMCPATSLACNDPSYYYGLFFFQGNSGTSSMNYYPISNTMIWTGNIRYPAFAGGGTQTLGVDNNGTLEIVAGGGGGSPQDVENDVSCSGTCTLLNTATVNIVTLTGNVTSSTLAAPAAAFHTNVIVCENATGGFSFTPPANMQWITAPMVTTANTCSAMEEIYSTALGNWVSNGPGVTGEAK